MCLAMLDNKMEKQIATRVPNELLKDIERSIEHNKYATISEFLRSAIREKLARERT